MTKQAKKSTKKIVESVGVLENANMVHALAYFPYFVGPIAMYFLGKSLCFLQNLRSSEEICDFLKKSMIVLRNA